MSSNSYGVWIFNGNAKCPTCSSQSGQNISPGGGHERCGCDAEWEGMKETEENIVLSEMWYRELAYTAQEADGTIYGYYYEVWIDEVEIRTYELQPDGSKQEVAIEHETRDRIEMSVDTEEVPLEPIEPELPDLEEIPQ